MKNALVATWSDAVETAQRFFYTFNSKTFWGWTERGCPSVCTLLSWLIRKNKLELSFWTHGFLLILYVLLTTASLVCYSPKRLPDIFCSPQHRFPKVPTQQHKLIASLFSPSVYLSANTQKEQFSWKGHLFQLSYIIYSNCLTCSGLSKSWSALTTLCICLLHTDRHGKSNTSLGSLFQYLRIQKGFPVPTLTLPCAIPILSSVLRIRDFCTSLCFPSSGAAECNEVTSWPALHLDSLHVLSLPQPFYQLWCPPLDAFMDRNIPQHCCKSVAQ